MAIVKLDPFIKELEEIQTQLGRLFPMRAARRGMEADAFFADWAPAADVQETDTEFLIKADLPEVAKEDVKVQVEDGVLTLQGERRREEETNGKRFHKVEREYGKFVRRFALPLEIDATKVQAEFKNGVLNVHLPKTAKAAAKAIEVKVA
jgi:HSP20 family protein